MSQNKKPKVIILEADPAVSDHACAVLEKEGWDVTSENVSREALDTLSKSKDRLYTLFISNYRLPKMEGDDVLMKVKSISPLTQRMLMVPDDEPETLIKAINKAEIHASIISPFNDENLVNQAEKCLKRFRHALKRARLKRVTSHQNKQMFNIAKKLKKKSQVFESGVEKKKTQLIKLKSEKRKLDSRNRLKTDITLEDLLENQKVSATPEYFQAAFERLAAGVRQRFNKSAEALGLSPFEPDESLQIEEKDDDPRTRDIIIDILTATFSTMADQTEDSPLQLEESQLPDEIEEPSLNQFLKISTNDDMTKAWAQKIKPPEEKSPSFSLEDILELLLNKEISYGIIPDEDIENWLKDSTMEKLLIAAGEPPVPGKDGSVRYHFPTDYSNPGKINEDGSIDFRERGEIPFVEAGELLAEKTPAEEGSAGITITGIPIAVEESVDPAFEAGSGTTLSEDGRNIHAEIDGQPHCDALGNITVNPDLVINGDVDYETGNIDFNGNIVVKGMIKEGFSVKGINVTAQEIDGGHIDISGDLNISSGITNSRIRAHGNTRAKFINNSHILGFGDVVISKEIIDSEVIISGCCINPGGHIISSRVSAKQGIEGGSIGTDASSPAKLQVGLEDHLNTLYSELDEKLAASTGKADILKDEIQRLEDEDQALYEQISENAHIQDRAQVELKEITASLTEIEKSNDLKRLHDAQDRVKQMKKTALEAEKKLNSIFKTQDDIAGQIESLKIRIERFEKNNKNLVLEKKALKEFAVKEKPKAFISVAKTITQGSSLKGREASLYLSEEKSRCRIQEVSSGESGIMVYEMQITDL